MSVNLAGVISGLLSATNRLSRVATVQAEGSLTPTDYRILSTLRQFGPMRTGELALYHRVSQPAISKAIASLEREGLTTRAADPADQRASLLALTEAGERAFSARLTSIGAVLAPLFSDLSEFDQHILQRATDLVENALASASD